MWAFWTVVSAAIVVAGLFVVLLVQRKGAR